MFSVVAGFVAAISLILMAVLDTFRFHQAHKILLLAYFGGIGVCAFLVMVVWVDQVLVPGRLRKWYVSLLSFLFILMKQCLQEKGVLQILSSFLLELVSVWHSLSC